MNIADVPGPQTVLADLVPITPALYRTLEAAVFMAHNYFAQRERDVDLSHHANIVRYEAKVLFEEQNFPMGDLANNGVLLTYKNYRIRILKADQGRVPCPGTTRAKQQFYRQLPLARVGDAPASVRPPEEITNLLLIWDVTATYALADLLVACPKYGDADRASVETFWKELLPHPAELVAPTAPGPIDADDEGDDLPLELVAKDKKTGRAE